MRILVTGASGYVGSFTVLKLLEAGYDVVALDNLSNSKHVALQRVQRLANRSLQGFYEADVNDLNHLAHIFMTESPDAIIHFAGLKNTRESLKHPGAYYSNNVKGTINVLHAMAMSACKEIVFSSSCTVYDPEQMLPFEEDSRIGPITPYGQSKAMAERIITDVCNGDEEISATLLRYFNPVGAHPTGMIGEDPNEVTNLFPIMLEVMEGEREILEIYGNDHNTENGTCVRDYIHVLDVAEAHVQALKQMDSGASVYNIGTGNGTSILELLNEFYKVTGENIPHKFVDAKEGDVASAYCDATLARKELGWEPKRSLYDMIQDAYSWKKLNPNGYND